MLGSEKGVLYKINDRFSEMSTLCIVEGEKVDSNENLYALKHCSF